MSKELEKLKDFWEEFVYHNKIDQDVRPEIRKSWQKCRRLGVDPDEGRGKRLDKESFASVLAENRILLETARPIMQSVYEIVEKSHFLLVLTDSVGYILEAIGDTSVTDRAENLRFQLGALWNEEEVGSNAIGIALDQDIAIQMRGAEHYCQSHHDWTCSAAPIHGSNGELVGCIDMSGSCHSIHPHTLGLVLAAAVGIESKLGIIYSEQMLRTALNGSLEGTILIDEECRAVWGNKAAEKLLGISQQHMPSLKLGDFLPDVDWNLVFQQDRKNKYFLNDTRLKLRGSIVYCSVAISAAMKFGSRRTFSLSLKNQEHLLKAANRINGNRASYTFDSIYTENISMKRVISLARKYAQYDGNIMITGESGTGKELFAQSIHNEGQRRNGPFVAVNCASVPRELVESELFGYEKGAFTGAKREGNPGKFELANNGTIFLDEIGEMPLEFQAKLLRIVETRCVGRLGSSHEKKLDVRIIVATNRNLKQEVDRGRFRNDLYYRLNVLELNIPPLRERGEDVVYCAAQFLDHFNNKYPDMQKSMDSSFQEALLSYSWPGNVRELQNNIERVFYSSENVCLTAQDAKWTGQDSILTEKEHQGEESGTGSEEGAEWMKAILRQYRGDVEAAARHMGISRASMYRRIKALGINPKKYRL